LLYATIPASRILRHLVDTFGKLVDPCLRPWRTAVFRLLFSKHQAILYELLIVSLN